MEGHAMPIQLWHTGPCFQRLHSVQSYHKGIGMVKRPVESSIEMQWSDKTGMSTNDFEISRVPVFRCVAISSFVSVALSVPVIAIRATLCAPSDC